LGRLPGVVAVAAGGSRAADVADADSDVDLYVYAPEPPPLEARARVAAAFSPAAEIGNDAWEPGDEWVDARSGVTVDVIYRTPAWIEEQLDRVLVRHQASLGYSTCLWHNVLRARPLVDPDGWYARLRASADRPYPEPLNALRPVTDVFAVAFLITPAMPAQGRGLQIELVPASQPSVCTHPGLELIRSTIPAARALPLLQALASLQAGRVVIPNLPGNSLVIGVDAA